MPDIGTILRHLSDQPAYTEIINGATQNNRFLHDLASTLHNQGQSTEALEVCALILADSPTDLDARLLSVRAAAAARRFDAALDQLIALRRQGFHQEAVVAVIVELVPPAAEHVNSCFAAQDYQQAADLSDRLAELCPAVFLFRDVRLKARFALQQQFESRAARLSLERYRALQELAEDCHNRLDLDAEIDYRLDLYRHPLDTMQHGGSRLNNLSALLSRILGVDQERISPERLALARRLLGEISAIPVRPAGFIGMEHDALIWWDRMQRILLATIDLDAVFGPPAPALPPLPTSFFSTTGAALPIGTIADRARALDVGVVFSTSTSSEYFARFARSYVSSILATCDCCCMIVICVCSPPEQLAAIVAGLGIHDPRLIYCSDHFDPRTADFTIYSPTIGEATSMNCAYYASAALMRIDHLLRNLNLPVFVSGIDTVLQRGVRDLIEQHRDADLVINRMGSHKFLGSQVVNNLVLTYPTANGLLFAEFLKSYLGTHLAAPVQTTFLDQLDLHLAKHHLMANGVAPELRYFDEFDINNIMFNRYNYRGHIDVMRRFRFLNMFVGACTDEGLTSEDVAA